MIKRCVPSLCGSFPFPYMLVDDVFSEQTLAEILRFWPTIDSFAKEGHHLHDLRLRLAEYQPTDEGRLILASPPYWERKPDSKTRFWRDFADEQLRPLGLEVLRYYSSFLERTWPDAQPDFYMSLYWLEDAPKSYPEIGLRVHTHYDHNPFWAISSLFYLNDAERVVAGTNLQYFNKADDLDLSCECAMNSRRWYTDESIEKVITFDFKKNRMVTFVDGPLSLHGVEKYKSTGVHKRKAILVHLALHPRSFKQRYGLGTDAFRAMLMTHRVTPEIRKTIRADVIRYREAVQSFQAHEPSQYADKIRLQRISQGSE